MAPEATRATEDSEPHRSDMARREALSQRFQHFADMECSGSSPLYEHQSRSIAADEEMLALAARCAEGQPPPNLLLGVVHLLLLQGAITPLSSFYPSLSPVPGDPAAAYPHFRDFCRAHEEEIVQGISSRRVQTNEVRRCSYLLPAFARIAVLANRPLALVEVGASAGLNLLWDRYAYTYRHGDETLTCGDTDSDVRIACALSGEKAPSLPSTMPTVSYRVGIDLNPVDLQDEVEALWLRALIWPEHEERRRLLDAASAIFEDNPPTLVAGDAVELLPQVLRAVPSDSALVVFHTHVLNQCTAEARERLAAIIAAEAAGRTVYRLGNDLGGGTGRHVALKLIVYQNGEQSETHLANCDGHGRSVEWLVSD